MHNECFHHFLLVSVSPQFRLWPSLAPGLTRTARGREVKAYRIFSWGLVTTSAHEDGQCWADTHLLAAGMGKEKAEPLPWLRQLHIAIMCSCGNGRQASLKTQQKLENEDWGNQNLLGILTISSLNFLWKKLKQINKPRTHKLRKIYSGVLTLYHLKENLLSFLTARVYVWGSANWSPTVHVTGLDSNKFWSVGPSFFLR